jgi:pilus assembly protein CpaC
MSSRIERESSIRGRRASKRLRVAGILLAFFLGLVPDVGLGADTLIDRVKDNELVQKIKLRKGQSKVLRIGFPVSRISVAEPDVADIVLISEREVYITGQAPGVTNISLWGKKRFSTAMVLVEPDVTLLKEKIHQVLPKEKIAVESAENSIILSGEVSGPIAQESAMNLALPYAGGKKENIVNLLHVGGVQQVMAMVRVAEIQRNLTNRMNINVAFANTRGTFGITTLGGLATITRAMLNLANITTPGVGTTMTAAPLSPGQAGPAAVAGLEAALSTNLTAAFGGQGAGNSFFWSAFFDVLKSTGLGKVLAEPNLVTTSGQEAKFLAGGEFPVPVPSGLGTVGIEYKSFGVGLVFTPTVLDDNKIALRINPEVSELDFTIGTQILGTNVPGLRTRRVASQVEIKDGQTIAIAGLLSDNYRSALNKFPVLGDIPILGALFRSIAYQKNETELVILVTTNLVKPLKPNTPRLPTDNFIEPSEYEFYLLGKDEGRTAKPKNNVAKENLPAGFGHQLE